MENMKNIEIISKNINKKLNNSYNLSDVVKFINYFINYYEYILFIKKEINNIILGINNKCERFNNSEIINIIVDYLINYYVNNDTDIYINYINDIIITKLNSIKNDGSYDDINYTQNIFNIYFKFDSNYNILNYSNDSIFNDNDNINIILNCIPNIFNIDTNINESDKIKNENENSIWDDKNKSSKNNFILNDNKNEELTNLKKDNERLKKIIREIIIFLKKIEKLLTSEKVKEGGVNSHISDFLKHFL
jgi:hypothetical protein